MRFWLPGRAARDLRKRALTFNPDAGIGVIQCPHCGCWMKTHTRYVRCPDCMREIEAPRPVLPDAPDDVPVSG